MAAKTPQGGRAKGGRLGDLVVVENQGRKHGAAKQYVAARLQGKDGKEGTFLFTENQLKVARERAAKNPEDIPKVGWLTDLLD